MLQAYGLNKAIFLNFPVKNCGREAGFLSWKNHKNPLKQTFLSVFID
jgi:hypothetical protein